MTAVALYDALETGEHEVPPPFGAALLPQRAALACKLVSACLSDFEAIQDYERFVSSADTADLAFELRVSRSIYEMYAVWAAEASEVSERVGVLNRRGAAVPGTDQLNDTLGRTRARLSVTPEQIAAARAQAGRGEFISAAEVRDELRARLRS